MSTLHSAALQSYMAVTSPWRWHYRHHAASVGHLPIAVLFYHRVADFDVTPWTIRCDEFRAHLDWIETQFEVISLAEVQRRTALRYSPRPAVAITFDDGYADNCQFALPELARRKLPATYFVTLGNIQSGEPFLHDVEAGLPAAINTVEQVCEMAQSEYLEIGSHTYTHPDFATICDSQAIEREVIHATLELEQIIAQKVRYFAFPFGQKQQLSDLAIHLLRQHGMTGFCSAYGGYNVPGDDPFHIQRIHADNDLNRLQNWLTIDPRKLYGVPRHQPKYRPLPSEVSL